MVDACRRGSGFFQHGHTYLGHAVACAAALAVQQVIEREWLLENVHRGRARCERLLARAFGDHPHVGDIRGRGCSGASSWWPTAPTRRRSTPRWAARARQEGGDGARPDDLPDGRHGRRRAGRPRPAGAALHRPHRSSELALIVERLAQADRRGDRAGLSFTFRHPCPHSQENHDVACASPHEEDPRWPPWPRCPRALAAPAAAQQKFVTIGTGGVTGVYYAAGGAICRLVNKDRAKHGIRCSVESTGGSVFNVNTIKAGELDLGFAQSDVQFNAVKGLASSRTAAPTATCARCSRCTPSPSPWWRARKPTSRQVRRLQGQALQRRQPRLGHARVDGGAARGAMGWKLGDFSLASELKADEHGPALCDGKIDGFFYGVGHPSRQHPGPDHVCGAKLVSLTGPAVDKLVADKPYYAKARSRRPVPEQPEPHQTYGVLATVVASAKTPADTVYAGGQGGVRQLRRVQEAAPGAGAPQAREHGQGRPLGAAARRRRALLQGKGLDQVSPRRLAPRARERRAKATSPFFDGPIVQGARPPAKSGAATKT
jgi:TRAP transporter TAXI family solute receptor